MEIYAEQTWYKIWNSFKCDTEIVSKTWTEIQKAYSSKSRHYHTMEHIVRILNFIEEYKSKIGDVTSMQLAVFFHDVVYSAKRKDNEEKSAVMAEKKLSQLNYPRHLIEKVREFIHATKHHINHLDNKDLDYLLDFDLEKLCAPWSEYLEYTNQIRKEYRIYPDIIYKSGRKKVLIQLLKMDRIYKTSEFYEKNEQSARQNLNRELEILNESI
jgi:predicted metal-dependent HD superfamily phosphohydrolase